MSYREDERKKVIIKRNDIFKDPGNGLFFGKTRDFVLAEPQLNLWEGIRFDALEYFQKNKIGWWKGDRKEPTGHLLSSQIACINHMYYLRQRKDMATAILKSLDNRIEQACIVDDGYVEFEFIGEKQYLKEKAFTRGANCTSIDAAMIGQEKNGERKNFLFEWKYTENYSVESKYIIERSRVYDEYITCEDSPFIKTIKPCDLYYEPFYQLMRQTILAEQFVKNSDHNVSSYMHVHVVPEKNIELRNKITSPGLKGEDIHDAWRNILVDDSKFIAITPEKFLENGLKNIDTSSVRKYLERRYWN